MLRNGSTWKYVSMFLEKSTAWQIIVVIFIMEFLLFTGEKLTVSFLHPSHPSFRPLPHPRRLNCGRLHPEHPQRPTLLPQPWPVWPRSLLSWGLLWTPSLRLHPLQRWTAKLYWYGSEWIFLSIIIILILVWSGILVDKLVKDRQCLSSQRKLRVVIMPNFSLVVVPQVVITTGYGDISDDKIGKLRTFVFQCWLGARLWTF